ncbi:DUF4233 domain-containing protein [Demequina mangrovi]|uniref:DUF4233 domain-containing protein n=1 Tax=Demequina mangrovi TaxID=1043493 RepID=A0A1H6Z9I6_9MICO|nr:DUF4233 domain-containing protein [Demequina mangrovi]SEJ50141.1 Protein of unknown function [Demequina mangrovi]
MSARPQRSARLIFCQAVLALEAFAALFATLVLWGLSRADEIDVPGAVVWGGGLGLMVLLGYAAGQQRKRWGLALGWALQVPMIVGGLIEPMIAIIGVAFLATWITGVRLGGRIDRERAERDAAAAAAEAAGETA